MVICGDLEESDQYQEAVTNPIVIVEVLSKSTADYDRGDKFYFYRQLPSLQEYLLIEQEKPVAELYYKKPQTDLWQISRFEGLDQQIILQSLQISVKMADLYYDIKLPN